MAGRMRLLHRHGQRTSPQFSGMNITLWTHNVGMMTTNTIQEDDVLSDSLEKFMYDAYEDKDKPSEESFMELVQECIKANRFDMFEKLMISSVKGMYLINPAVVQQVISELISSDHINWLKIVCQCSEETLFVNELLMAFWTRKRFDLSQSCIPLNHKLRLNLETAHVILKDAVQKEASDDMLKTVLVIAKTTDFLTCMLQLENKLSDPAVKNLVDYIFLHLNVLELNQEQMKPLSMCSKMEVVFGKILLEAALQGNVCPLHVSLQLLGTLNKTTFGVLDFEFLAPIFSEKRFLHCVKSSMAHDTRDVVILLIRSGLLHQFSLWLKTKLEECHRKGCPRCKYCDASSYLVNSSVPDGPAIQQLLLQSGFLPNRLLFQLPDVLPQPPPTPTSSSTSATSTSSSSQDMNSVVKAFVQQPYSLLTMAAAKVSTMIGGHCGRTERIRKLPIPKLVQDHVAFRAGDFKLASEKEKEKNLKIMEHIMEDVYDGGDEDVDINHLYSEEEDDGDDGEGEAYFRLSVAGEADEE